MLKEIQDLIKISHVHESDNLTVKDDNISQINLRFNAIPINIRAGFFLETDKWILKFIWKCKGPESQNNLEKEKERWKFHTFNLKTFYKIYGNQDNVALA